MENCQTNVDRSYEVIHTNCFKSADNHKIVGVCVGIALRDKQGYMGPYVKPKYLQVELNSIQETLHVHCGLLPYTLSCNCNMCNVPSVPIVATYSQVQTLSATTLPSKSFTEQRREERRKSNSIPRQSSPQTSQNTDSNSDMDSITTQ